MRSIRAKELEEDYRAIPTKTLASVGAMLARSGEPFDRELNTMLQWTRSQVPDVPEFAVWMAEALAWARYAVRSDDFFEAAARFISDGDAVLLDEATQFPDRFGDARLRDALAAFRRWFEEMTEPLTTITPEPLRWKKLQERARVVAERLKKQGELRGIGMWLFPAPFKIMAVAHTTTWAEGTLDDVIMPTGTQVERALGMLARDGVVKIDKGILAASNKSFADEFTNLWTLQIPQRALAKAGNTSVLHINGALHELGDRG